MLGRSGYGDLGEIAEIPEVHDVTNGPPFSEYDVGILYYGQPSPSAGAIEDSRIGLSTNSEDETFILSRTNSSALFSIVLYELGRIHVKSTGGQTMQYLKPAQIGIYVPTKNH